MPEVAGETGADRSLDAVPPPRIDDDGALRAELPARSTTTLVLRVAADR